MNDTTAQEFNFHYPGSWIDHSDKSKAFKQSNLLTLAVSEFNSAATALNLFVIENTSVELHNRYKRAVPFLYAHSYLFSLDNVHKIMGVLAKEDVPLAVIDAIADFQAKFSTLVEIRNSAHHVEDRARGIGKRGKTIKPKPIDTPGIKASGGVLIMSNLSNNRYGCTLHDGTFGEIEISSIVLTEFQGSIQKILDAFKWTGSDHWELD